MYYYIINPAAGGGKINKVQTKLKARLKELGILGEFVKSIGGDDVSKLTRIGLDKGFKTIVAVGGDGTINEVINAIQGENATLGIIPLGSTNDLANTLGIYDWQNACNILAARKTEVVDLGKIGDNLFVTNLSIGFDNFLTDNVNLKDGSLFSKIMFFKKFFKEAKRFKVVNAVLEFDEGYKVEADCFSITVSSGKFSHMLKEKNRIQDDRLDVILINKLPFRKIFNYTVQNENIDYNYFSFFRTKRVKIITKKPIPVFADGQKIDKTPVIAEVAEKKLRVIVSRSRKF